MSCVGLLAEGQTETIRFGLAPELEQTPEVLGELLDSCSGNFDSTFRRTASLACARAEELPGHLVEVRQVLGAELLETRGLEPLLGDPSP